MLVRAVSDHRVRRAQYEVEVVGTAWYRLYEVFRRDAATRHRLQGSEGPQPGLLKGHVLEAIMVLSSAPRG